MSRRKDAKAALLQSRQHELNTLVQAGRMDEAMESAQKWGLDVDAVLDAVGQEPGTLPTPPTFFLETANSVEAPTPPPAPEPPLWPETADVVIASHPLNKRLYVIRLNDGRRASLWRMGGVFPVGAGLRAKLVEQIGDQAYYEPIHS